VNKFGNLGGIREELDALVAQNSSAVFAAPIDSLEESAQQLRIEIGMESIVELAQSMQSVGLVQPIAVSDIGGGKYVVVAGHRRVAAAKALGWDSIPANIVGTKDGAALALEGLVENIQREDFSPLELALAVDRAMAVCGAKASEFAKMIGKSPVWVSKARALLSLPQEILNELALALSPQERRRLGLDALAELSRVEDEELCVSLFARLRGGEIGRDEMREEIRTARAPVAVQSMSAGVAVASFDAFGFMGMEAEAKECTRVFESSFPIAPAFPVAVVEEPQEQEPVYEEETTEREADTGVPEAVLWVVERMNEAQLLGLQAVVTDRLAKFADEAAAKYLVNGED